MPAGVKIYINKSLFPYYKKLWTKCRKLWDAKRILSFWVSNESIRVKLVNGNVSIITHDCDWEKLSPGDLLNVMPTRFYIDRYGSCLCFDIVLGCASKFNFLFVTTKIISHHLDQTHLHRFFIIIIRAKIPTPINLMSLQ